MNTINYMEVQQNLAAILQRATKENIIIDGIDGNKFILSFFQKAPLCEKKQKLSERFAGALHLTDKQYNNFQTQLLENRNEWERSIY
jgi:hypothetical protein